MKHEPRHNMAFFEFKDFMRRNKRDLDHLTSPETGLSHEGEFESLLDSLIIIPVSSERPTRKGALLMFSSALWEVGNIHWDHVGYQSEQGIKTILIIAKDDEELSDIVLRAKVLVFKFMRPKMYNPNDHNWKQIKWTTGGIYKPQTSVVVSDIKTTSRVES